MASSKTPMGTMRWASASSTHPVPATAAGEVADRIAAGLGDGPVDLLAVFIGASHVTQAAVIADALRARLSPACLIGGSAAGVIGAEHEIERGVAVTAVAARLPGVWVHPFVLDHDAWQEALDDELAFSRLTPGAHGAELVILLADPFSLDIVHVLECFRRHAPDVRIVGGMTSAAQKPGGNVVVLNDWVESSGGVAVALKGALRADVIVSQGCRAVGPPLTVTAVQGHVVSELDGRPALERVEEVLRELPAEERERLAHGLYVGRPTREGAEGRGDYLIRNLMGADRDRGAIAVGDFLKPRERVRLHVRDAASALEDLELLLAPQEFDSAAAAAFLFSCNGRGQGLFQKPDGDLTTLQAALRGAGARGGPVPVAGMFCAGEIGPVGDRHYVHGQAASIAILRPAASAG
jgi:small ligand-binding sensory domain FIST